MASDNLAIKAIDSSLRSKTVFCKFLSANDSGETHAHQVGILISSKARSVYFSEEELSDSSIVKHPAHVCWNGDFFTDSRITWYPSKTEVRLTTFGKKFPLLQPEYTGALFVFTQFEDNEYEAFMLNTEDTIQQYLDAFGLTPAETNRIVEIDGHQESAQVQLAIEHVIATIKDGFPSASEMSDYARKIYYRAFIDQTIAIRKPDEALLQWTNLEYALFRSLEQDRYSDILKQGFSSVDEFVTIANQVLNRRKSRAGKALENHLSAIFDCNNIRYSSQAVTEANKKPDFVFPSIADYHDFSFPVSKLCTLAAKTTCKDRWRQILNEADRLRDHRKYLCTLQQGMSRMQMDEMEAEQVTLVVPKRYISTYPPDRQSHIWTLEKFIGCIRDLES